MTDTNPPDEEIADVIELSPDDVLVTEPIGEVSLFDAPIPERMRPEHISEVIAINGLDLESLPEELTVHEFAVLGTWVQMTSAGSSWWEGDWGNYGDLHYGDEYFSAIEVEWSDSTEHARRRVTAGAFPHDRRRPELQYEHHQVVAQKIKKGADIDAERDAWLQKAVDEGLTVAQLAKEIKDAQAIDVTEVEEESRPDPASFTTFTISITVPVVDAETAAPIMERAEGMLRAEIERAGGQVQTVSNKRKG